MNVFKRELSSQLSTRLTETVKLIQVIGGPRQTGKTTLVKQACETLYKLQQKTSLYCSVDEPNLIAQTIGVRNLDDVSVPPTQSIDWLVYQWQKARSKAYSEECKKTGYILVLDEIQKIPNWSEAVKGLWDEDRSNQLNLHVVLLGSSPLLLQQGISESLLGRYELLENHHWSFSEMSEAFDFNIDEYIYFGGYPGAASLIRDEPRWMSYVQHSLIDAYLLKDIVTMARIDKPQLLKQAFELSCEYSGQIFAYNNMLGQLTDAGNVTTLAHYMQLMSNVGLVTGLPAYSNNKLRKRASKPKINVMNTALMSCYSGYSFAQAKADRTNWGRMVESCVGAHLLNTANNHTKIYYWRERGDEVDFVVEKNRRTLAIEVKSTKTAGKLNGLKKFVDQFENAKPLLVGANGIDLEQFLSHPIDYWFEYEQ